jgi:hypothetical protein
VHEIAKGGRLTEEVAFVKIIYIGDEVVSSASSEVVYRLRWWRSSQGVIVHWDARLLTTVVPSDFPTAFPPAFPSRAQAVLVQVLPGPCPIFLVDSLCLQKLEVDAE